MKKFKELTKAQQKEYILLLLILPVAYIWHRISKTDLRALRRKAVAICVAVLMLITTIPMVFGASTATMIRAVDNNPNLGKKTFDVTITFKTSTAASSLISSTACDNSFLFIIFPAGTTKTSVSKSGASDGSEVNNRDFYRYDVKLGKNFMTTKNDTVTINFKGLNALPSDATLILASTTISRTYKGDLTITQNGSEYHKATLGGSTGYDYGTSCKDSYPSPTSSTINLSTTSVTAPLSSTGNITYTVYSNSHRGSDLADGYLLKTSEGRSWNCKGYVISERLVCDTNTSSFSANGISLDSKNKKVLIDGAAFNSAGKTCKFRIESTLVSGNLSGSTVSYLGNTVKVYSPVITVTPLNKYTVKFNANGGSGSMSNQSFYWSEAKNLTANAFTYTPKVTFNENGGNAVSDAVVSATFGGWEDRSTTTFGGTTYKYTDFDAPGYAIRNNDVFVSGFCNSVYDKNGLLDHYINHGKNEYANGSTSRAPNTGYIYGYPNGAKVANLTTTANGTVNLYAKWKYGNTTLPTPQRAGYTFGGWKGDLMDVATLTNGMEISNVNRGTIGSNASYAVTENLIPVVGGATYVSNYEVCGLYSFDANGNFIRRESTYATTHTVSSNAAFVRIEVNTTKGITFDQYQSGLTLTYTLPAGTSFPVGGNQTLTATWTPATYTITFDAQGGTTSLTSLPVVYGSNQNNKIDAATNPTKTDYTFLGWFTQPQGGEQVYKTSNGSCYAGEYWSNTWETAGTGAVWQHPSNVTLYAHWAYTGTCVITFDAQGGTTSLTSLSVVYGSNQNNRIDVTTNPTKEGYIFDGWFDAPEGGSRVYKSSNGSCYAGDYWTNAWEIAGTGATWKGPKELTLYAHWIPKKYTVNFNANGGSVGTPSKTVTYDSTYGDLPEPTKKGYIFDGWYTNQNFETKVTRITEVQITENQTLYAKWRPNTYQANLYANGGSVSPTSIIVTYDSPYGTLPTPTRTGYTFNGWFTQSSGGDRVESTTVVKTASTHSLCAQWDANTYTVNFNANGGSVGTPSKTVTYDSTYGELPTPTRENHTFAGWFTAAEGGTQITSATAVKITESQTLYARWNINTYTVTWKNYDGSVLETDTGVTYGATPTYNGATPERAEDEDFTYTFVGWSPAFSAVIGDTEYIAQFTAESKRVDPAYTVTIPAAVNEGESFMVSATEVVLNTDQTLTVTLQSDFTLTNEQGAELGFKINDGAIVNNTQLISVAGNGDKNTPLAKDSEVLRVEVTEEAKYSGIYTATITFIIAVNTAPKPQ